MIKLRNMQQTEDAIRDYENNIKACRKRIEQNEQYIKMYSTQLHQQLENFSTMKHKDKKYQQMENLKDYIGKALASIVLIEINDDNEEIFWTLDCKYNTEIHVDDRGNIYAEDDIDILECPEHYTCYLYKDKDFSSNQRIVEFVGFLDLKLLNEELE